MEEKEFKLDFSNWKNYLLDPFNDNPKYRFSKFIQKYIWIFLLLTLLFVNFDVRTQNLNVDISEEWAEQSIRQNFLNSQLNEINSQFPNVDSQGKQQLAQKRWIEFSEQNKQVIDQQTEILSDRIKAEFQNEDGETYLVAIDPYYYYRQARNLLNNGHVGEILIEGQSIDKFRLAPNNNEQPLTNSLHPYFAVYSYKILNFFIDISLYKTFFILPIIGIGIAIIFAFLIGRQITNTLGGFIFSYLVGFHTSIFQRTVGGFSDTDMYVIFFPLIILYFIINVFQLKKIKWKITNLIFASFFTGLFSFAWGGYWYFFLILLISLFLYLIILVIKEYKLKKSFNLFKYDVEIKNTFYYSFSYFVLGSIFVVLIKGVGSLISLFKGPFGFLLLKETTKGISIWPNVYTTVAELNPSNFLNTFSSLSGGGSLSKGILLTILGFIGLIILFVERKNSNFNIKLSILGFVWFIVLFWTTFSGVRFIMVTVLPFAFIISIFFGKISKYLSEFSNKEFKLSLITSNLCIFVLVFLLLNLIFPLNTVYAFGSQSLPSLNDAWVSDLNKIKTETHNDSIITSWWDFGHQFITVSNRGATFDGGSQLGELAHWVGRSLLTNNESEAKNILRMLHCSNHRFGKELEKKYDNYDTLRLIETVIFSSKENAKQILLNENYSVEEVDVFLGMTHCTPQDGIFITSQDMVSKAAVWAHFGGWNFDRAYAWKSTNDLLYDDQIKILNEKNIKNPDKLIDSMNVNAYDEESANYWISGFPNYVGNYPCQKNENEIICNVNTPQGALIYTHNLKNNQGSFQNNQKPHSFNYLNSDYEFESINYENASINFALTLYENDGRLLVSISHPDLAGSMFSRLFYLNGLGLKNFKFFDEQRSQSGFKISSWLIDWDSNEMTKPKNYLYNVSHILIGHSEVPQLNINRTKEEALKFTNDVLNNLTIHNFKEKAIEFSEDPSVVVNGGNMGLGDLNGFVLEFSDAAKELNVGEISKPIESQFGYHIILLNNKTLSFSDFIIK
ncbi:hypothetical protein HOK68_04550 [Candidatus Woesearchaeota archaeon]|jgi:dolichyl-phosphooligosaccharide-protein glycotransferase|nr:hypothetical protein [Candidatus Woesearchaeota archaeon]MBT4387365.1 hypothetical protein [Candidatus Woesearchaeota archaeon]MBT4595504.1 hypothetical protein [Candidatus Woesearchaeota archaeon]MBT6506021.1 hypothetical protein [Candidatus Woesearchaeota archaeon]MBT7849567.1 hypothetical protein [Candidatus Woesearchaeota archaeon]